jgi:hypothetical protein
MILFNISTLKVIYEFEMSRLLNDLETDNGIGEENSVEFAKFQTSPVLDVICVTLTDNKAIIYNIKEAKILFYFQLR